MNSRTGVENSLCLCGKFTFLPSKDFAILVLSFAKTIQYMKNPMLLLIVLMLATAAHTQSRLESPDEFLPHRIGETFTPHHLLVDYYEYVADNSPYVKLIEYGRTNEQRPLIMAFVSTPENLARLEQIRENHLRKAGLLAGQATNDNIAIVWLSFSVHGNEAAGSESSMPVLYELVDPNNARTKEWLKNTIVILAPSLNPDGYSRYTHWYRGAANRIPNPNLASREHNEPWPGGRVNHYLFDLNRDWAWATQLETQHLLEQYRQWMPHIHADIHEQGMDSPYYFAPAAEPFHKYITDWQREFQTQIGKNHAKYFDENGWLYFTKERFDLFYPSYGDTYPIFNGAIGMTYEQGGHSRAGRAGLLNNGDTLRLIDRIMHHKTTALSTVEIASQHADAVNENFRSYFNRAANTPSGEYKTYVIKAGTDKDRLKRLTKLLDRHNIQYGSIKGSQRATGFDYLSGEEKSINILPRDLVVSAYQPMGTFAQVLFDPEPELVDSLTYDITAWAIPYIYGLEAYAFKQRIQPEQNFDINRKEEFTDKSVAQPYAYVVAWKSLEDARFLSELMKQGVRVRLAQTAFRINGLNYERGTLVITRADNKPLGLKLGPLITQIANTLEQEVNVVETGFVEVGPDLGSDVFSILKAPNVAIVGGKATFPNEFGQVWWYFEQELNYPITVIDSDDLEYADLRNYDVLVLPEGRYRLHDRLAEKLNSWVSSGGRLIAIGYAVRSLEGQSGFSLTGKSGDSSKEAAEPMLGSYAAQERESISEEIPGAIFKTKLDNTHPLGYGLSDTYFTLKSGSMSYPYQSDMWNVATIGKEPFIQGFVGANAKKAQEESVIFAVEEKGRGVVIYMIDNPLYRGFWEQGKFLFSNAVFFVGQ